MKACAGTAKKHRIGPFWRDGSLTAAGHGVDSEARACAALSEAVVDFRGVGFILIVGCAAAATGSRAGTDASSASDAASATRRGNVLTLRKSPPQSPSPNHAPVVESFVHLAAGGNLDALFQAFDEVPVQANGEAAIKHYLTREVIPFFADADRLDAPMRVTEASFEDGTTGHMAYSYVVTTSGQIKPFVIAWRSNDSKLRVMDVQMGRCVKARHPVTADHCDR